MKLTRRLFLLLSLIAGTAAARAATPDDLFAGPVIARGKGIEIRRSQLDDAFVAYRANLAARGQGLPEGRRLPAEALLLDRMIVTELLVQKATPEDRVAAKTNAVKFFEESRKSIESDEAFVRHLKSLGMTSAQFTNRVMEQAISEEVVRREVQSTITIPEEALKNFYATNTRAFTQPELARASHIVLATRDFKAGLPLTAEQKQAKKKKAEEALERLRKGEDFAKLAKEYSDDPTIEYKFARAKDNPRLAMAPEFETAAFGLRPGMISDIITTDLGYDIIRLEEIIPAKTAVFAEVRDKIRQHLVQVEMEKRMPDYFAALKKSAGVEILDDTLRQALERASNPADAK